MTDICNKNNEIIKMMLTAFKENIIFSDGRGTFCLIIDTNDCCSWLFYHWSVYCHGKVMIRFRFYVFTLWKWPQHLVCGIKYFPGKYCHSSHSFMRILTLLEMLTLSLSGHLHWMVAQTKEWLNIFILMQWTCDTSMTY